jgi:hypothetical protein
LPSTAAPPWAFSACFPSVAVLDLVRNIAWE